MTSTGTSAPGRLDRRRAGRAVVVLWLMMALGLGVVLSQAPEPAAAATCPCSIFTTGQTPANPAENDTDAVELGVKFRADQAGFITGIRFYKGTGNTGAHTGSLWSAAGARLATVTFTGETATGWQQALFAAPVAVTANTTYTASYYAPVGRYAADLGYFATSGVTNSPLTALASGVDGGNGVYRYGSGGGFPSSSYQSTNYWVDVVFDSTAVDTTKPTVTDRAPAAGATGVPTTGTTVSATFSESVVATSPVDRRHQRKRGGGRHHDVRRQHAHRDLHAVRRAARGDLDRQRHGRSGLRRQPDGPGDLDLHDREQQRWLSVHDLAVHHDARPPRRPPTPPPWSWE